MKIWSLSSRDRVLEKLAPFFCCGFSESHGVLVVESGERSYGEGESSATL